MSLFVSILGGFWKKRVALITIDIFIISLTFFISFFVVNCFVPLMLQFRQHVVSLLVLMVFLLISLYVNGGYKKGEDKRSETEVAIVVKSVCFSFMLMLFVNFVVFKGVVYSRYAVLTWWVLLLPFLLLARLLFREAMKRCWAKGYLRQRVLLVGFNPHAKNIVDRFRIQRHRRFDFVGVLMERDDENLGEFGDLRILGKLNDFSTVIDSSRIDRVFIGLQDFSRGTHEKIGEIIARCRARDIPVTMVSETFHIRATQMTVDEFSGLITLESRVHPFSRLPNRFLKRSADIAVSLLLLPLLGLMAPIIGFIHLFRDRGPIFYRRRVMRRGGGEFDAYKFRTMMLDADKIIAENKWLQDEFNEGFKLKNDPRVTHFGRLLRRYSLNEFPQIVNVLRGEMSLVGPRMIVKDELLRFGESGEKLLSVRPGLTGFWQTQGRSNTSYDERVEMEMFYIDHWSVWLDIALCLKTIIKVITAEGAY